jgi:DNA helicase II / ATP-dependent DNA helicase PcrA
MISLNNEQQAAARAAKGATLVLAGAGSGKTKTLIERVRNTLLSGLCAPENILIMTFSNKAACEIRDRVCEGLNSAGKDIIAGTFHAVALLILRKFAERYIQSYGFSSFPKILDEAMQNDILIKLFDSFKEDFLGMPCSVVLSILQNDKSRKINSEMSEAFNRFRIMYAEYKKSRGLIDFNDIIHHTTNLITEDKDVSSATTALYRYIFVDEYQDISKELFDFITVLAGSECNVFAVGDDRQSIYGFRGADITYIQSFKKIFPDCALYFLSRNYRSYSEIVFLSDIFISSNKKQYKNKSAAPRGKGADIQSFPINKDHQEVAVMKSLIMKHEKFSDIMILCRNNWQCDNIQKTIIPEFSDYTIRCMTVHASKGLESEMVIISGITDGIFPDKYTDIEEERRLFYVAVTRAKKNLYLLYRVENEKVAQFIAESVLSKKWALRHPVSFCRDAIKLIKANKKCESAIELQDTRSFQY